MTMRLGIGSYSYVWSVGVPGDPLPPRPMTPQNLLDKAAALGVHVVQFADHMPLHRMSDAELNTLRERADEHGIEVEVGTSGIGRGHVLRHIDIAARVGARLVRTVTDTATHHPAPREAVDMLTAIAPELERRGVTLALENHDRFKAITLRQIIDDVGSPCVGICLDTANSLGCSEGPDLVLENLGPRTCCLHVKDYTTRRLPHRFGFLVEGCPAGAGDLDIPKWLARLREMGRNVNVILELWPGLEPKLEDTIAKEERWATQSIAYLRRFIHE